ncbi:hypothetical protein KEM55_006390, partial [Ascosphaera atra]
DRPSSPLVCTATQWLNAALSSFFTASTRASLVRKPPLARLAVLKNTIDKLHMPVLAPTKHSLTGRCVPRWSPCGSRREDSAPMMD